VTPIFSRAVIALWSTWGIYWLIAARNVKPSLRRVSVLKRVLHSGPLLLCGALFFSHKATPPFLNERFLPQSPSTEALGTFLLAMGMAFAFWARLHLGRNWSSVVELKSDHALIRTGPYRLVRHPIYSGLLLGLFGTSIAIGEWRGLLGAALAFLAICLRIRGEDALMAEAFDKTYEVYRRDTPALVPYLFWE